MVIFAGVNFISFLLFLKDTFRKERSLTYQTILRRRIEEDRAKEKARGSLDSEDKTHSDTNTLAVPDPAPPIKEIKLSLADVNPFPPLALILRRRNNLAILFPSGESSYTFCMFWFSEGCMSRDTVLI